MSRTHSRPQVFNGDHGRKSGSHISETTPIIIEVIVVGNNYSSNVNKNILSYATAFRHGHHISDTKVRPIGRK